MKKQDIKVGDKLICKKDFNILNISLTERIEYTIISIRIIHDYVGEYEYYYTISDNNHKDMTIADEEDLYTYFYSDKEVRKMKLKRLELCQI